MKKDSIIFNTAAFRHDHFRRSKGKQGGRFFFILSFSRSQPRIDQWIEEPKTWIRPQAGPVYTPWATRNPVVQRRRNKKVENNIENVKKKKNLLYQFKSEKEKKKKNVRWHCRFCPMNERNGIFPMEQVYRPI